jgi:beta-1,4-mannosyl-glycoprotein beta-1,4-N-acetylglucosaminyltransferase
MVIEGFIFFNELELLDIHLHELSGIVDKFVLVEATKTFQGKDKPLFFDLNKEQFKKFLPKIQHIIVEFPDKINNKGSKLSDAWGREYYQRDKIGDGFLGALENDLVIVSDVDEIISAEKLKYAVANRKYGDFTVFLIDYMKYYLNRKTPNYEWYLGPRMIEYKYFVSAQNLRRSKLFASRRIRGLAGKLQTRLWNYLNCGLSNDIYEVKNSGWHFSSIGGWDKFREKISAFSHTEDLDTQIYKDEDCFYKNILNSTVLVDNSELPDFVQKNLDKYSKHLFTSNLG